MTEREQFTIRAMAGVIECELGGYEIPRQICLKVAEELYTLADSEGKKLLGIIAKDQSLPDNQVWHRDEREFEAYCAGRNDMADRVKIEKGNEMAELKLLTDTEIGDRLDLNVERQYSCSDGSVIWTIDCKVALRAQAELTAGEKDKEWIECIRHLSDLKELLQRCKQIEGK